MFLKALRVVVLVFVVVGGFWRFLLSKSYLGFLKVYTMMRLLVAVSQFLVLFVPTLSAIATWMLVMWIDLAFTHTPKKAKKTSPVWIASLTTIWLFSLFDPQAARIFSWILIGTTFLFFNLFWPFFAPKKIYRYGKRPKSAVFLCPIFTVLAVLAGVFIEVFKTDYWSLFCLLLSVFFYEWFYTWRFAVKSLQKTMRKEFNTRFSVASPIPWQE